MSPAQGNVPTPFPLSHDGGRQAVHVGTNPAGGGDRYRDEVADHASALHHDGYRAAGSAGGYDNVEVVQSLFAKGSFSIGFINLSKTTNFSISGVPSDSAGAFFAQISSEFLTASGLGTQMSIGGCSLLVQNLPTPTTGT